MENWVEQAENTKIGQEQIRKVDYTSMVLFGLGHEHYGVPISKVREVVLAPYITALPQMADHMLGVCNVRGNVIAAVDAEYRVSGSSNTDRKGYLIILRDKEINAGLLVKTVPQTVLIETETINNSASVIKSLDEKDQYVNGVFKYNGQMIFQIDPFKLIE